MHKETDLQKPLIIEFIKGLKVTGLIALAFFAVNIIGKDISLWILILKISLSYAISIYSMIWISYSATAFLMRNQVFFNEATKVEDLNVKGHLIINAVGLTIGALIAEYIKAGLLDREMRFAGIPFIILIGIFASLAFIYKDQQRLREKENEELQIINAKLKQRQDKTYLSTLSASLGSQKKIIAVKDIHHFKSIDHYTYAFTSEGEYIVDHSIKNLSNELDPSQFVQIHRNCIVSLNQISSIENGSQWFVKTKSGEELKVSRNSKKRLKESLG